MHESLVVRALEQALDCILRKTREDMTPDEENRQPNSVRLAVMTAWHSGERHMMAPKMSRVAAAISRAGWAPELRLPRLLSVVEFCGNELTICRNTFGLVLYRYERRG